MKNYERQVTVENILDEGKLELTEDWKINDHNAMIEKFKAKGVFDEKLSDDRLQNLANYFVTLPSEIAMTLWQAMGTTEFATLQCRQASQPRQHLVAQRFKTSLSRS